MLLELLGSWRWSLLIMSALEQSINSSTHSKEWLALNELNDSQFGHQSWTRSISVTQLQLLVVTNDSRDFNIDTNDSCASEWRSGNLETRVDATLRMSSSCLLITLGGEHCACAASHQFPSFYAPPPPLPCLAPIYFLHFLLPSGFLTWYPMFWF